MIDTNMYNRPIFFKFDLDLCVDLSCPMTPEALKLDVHIQSGEFYDSKNFTITYRVYFRLMSTGLIIKILSTSPSNSKQTILLQIEDDKPQVFSPKLLKLDEITTPQVIELDVA